MSTPSNKEVIETIMEIPCLPQNALDTLAKLIEFPECLEVLELRIGLNEFPTLTVRHAAQGVD